MKKYQNLGVIIALVLSSSTFAEANDLYNNLPADVSQIDDGLGLSGAGFAANEFSIGNSCPKGCTLQSITLNLTSQAPTNSGIQLAIVADNHGAPGTTPLFIFTDPTSYTTTFGNSVFTAPSGANLTSVNTPNADNNYWVVLTNSNTSNPLNWDYSTSAVQTALNQPNLLAYQDSNGNAFSGAYGLLMEVKVQQTIGTVGAVPLPGAVWLMGSALIGFATVKQRKSRI